VVLSEHRHSQLAVAHLVTLFELEGSHEQFEQGAFSDPVGADYRDPAFHIDAYIQVPEDGSFRLVLEQAVLETEQGGTQFVGVREYEDAGWVLNDLVDSLHLLDCFDPALDQRGSFGVVPEFVDEGLNVTDFSLLAVKFQFLTSDLLIA
jgi:hypothetical protein